MSPHFLTCKNERFLALAGMMFSKPKVFGLLLVFLFFCGRADALVYPPLVDNDEWAGMYFKGKKLGFSHSVLHVGAEFVTVTTQNYMKLKNEGVDQVTSFTQETVLTPDLRLVSFSLLQEVSGHRQRVDGRMKNGELLCQITNKGYGKEKRIPFPSDMAVSSTYMLNIYKRGLQAGAKGTVPIFIEVLQSPSLVEYEVLRQERMDGADIFVIRQKLGGMESTLWVAEDGSVIKELSAQGFESRRESKAVAQALAEETLTMSSFITLSLVKPQREIISPYTKRRLVLKLSHLRMPDLMPIDRRQRVLKTERESDQSYVSTLEVSSELPIQRAVSFPVKLFPELLEDTPEIQSAHPEIRTLARQLVGNKKDAWEAALSINHWVYKNMEKAMIDTVTALDALHDRRGECQSHTNLFVALARAAGIPARVISGLVYSNEYNGFLYHAWPEVYVGEWRALDPTFGQDLVDATHIKLGEWEQAGPLKLLDFIGKVGIELID